MTGDPPTRPLRRAHHGYGVKLVRGPFVRLEPHPDACAGPEAVLGYAARLRVGGARLAADLFCGAGGLSLGLVDAGYTVVLGVDHDPEAVETHRHHHGGLTVDWDLADPGRIRAVADLIRAAGVELLAGGPPCQPFSKAGRSMIRHRVRHGLRDPYDERRDLWRSFLEVVEQARPAAVLMENVPDMALDKEMFIFRTVVHELEELGYGVASRVMESRRFGVPQFRQRLIIVGLSSGSAYTWPPEAPDRVTVMGAIGDLPKVEGGWRPEGGADGWADYDGPQDNREFQKLMRHGVPEADQRKVFDHITRPVREDDARAFEMMDKTTRYSDLPEDVKRYRDDIFDDKYKRLDPDGPSRTITAHIAKDGYWYIHPEQNRTLTVREAARLQTFPDRIRFAGPPSAAFRQIGNAVPPLLARQLAESLRASVDTPRPARTSTRQVAAMLADWFDSGVSRTVPWLRAGTRWQVIQAEILLDRAHPATARPIWDLIQDKWPMPQDTVAAEDQVLEVARWIQRDSRGGRIVELAATLAGDPDVLHDDERLRAVPGLYETLADLAILAVPSAGEDEAEEPVLAGKGVLRVAARFSGEPVDLRNRLSDGRLAVARMIGDDNNARSAHLGLIELANSLCAPVDPECAHCPLRGVCAQAEEKPGLFNLYPVHTGEDQPGEAVLGSGPVEAEQLGDLR
jgi:DNA (cytosine-5)-methyltransferase 1